MQDALNVAAVQKDLGGEQASGAQLQDLAVQVGELHHGWMIPKFGAGEHDIEELGLWRWPHKPMSLIIYS